MSNETCNHIESIDDVKQAKRRECEECVKIGARWMHLRTCQTCGVTLCCDSSPNRHASKHARQVNHPVVASAEDQVLTGVEYADLGVALGRLSPELHAVVQATVLDGLTTREAAKLLHIPQGTVKTRMADLEKKEFVIDPGSWDLIAMCYYFQRDLLEPCKLGVVPGACIVSIALLIEPGKENSPFRLQPGELRGYFAAWEILHYREGRDVWYWDEVAMASTACEPAEMNAEDPLFILYTSGSTGTPKGVVHTTGGYLIYASMTHQYVFDYHDGDVYWCTADVGWVTGHSYIVYGPLANGATCAYRKSNPVILMVQSAEDRAADDIPSPLNATMDRGILVH